MMFDNFSDSSRVWLYKSDRELNASEQEQILSLTDDFLKNWAAHGNQLFGKATILENWVLVISVNEGISSASGCSIDSKVKFIKNLGEKLSIDFFNRMKVLVKKENEHKEIHFSEISDHPDWLLLNPLLSTMKEFRGNLWVSCGGE